MNLEESLKLIFGTRDFITFGVQFLVSVVWTLLLIYSVVFTTKRSTYVRSHAWILIETLVASAMCFGIYCLLVVFDMRHLVWAIPLCLFSGVVEYTVWRVDGGWIAADGRKMLGGRSMIDVEAQKKGLFQTDFRLVRRAAMFTLIIMWLTWRSVSSS